MTTSKNEFSNWNLADLKNQILWYTKQGNQARIGRNKAKTPIQKQAWQKKVDIAEDWKNQIQEIINQKSKSTMKAPAKKPTAKQLAARKRFAEMAKNGTLAKKRKAAPKKKGLGLTSQLCRRKNADGSHTMYGSFGGTNPCPYGGTVMTNSPTLNGAKKAPTKRKKSVSAKSICRKVIKVPGINSRTGQLLKGWHYVKGKPVKATKKVVSKKKATTKRKITKK